jgi:maltose-binding protein MalE
MRTKNTFLIIWFLLILTACDLAGSSDNTSASPTATATPELAETPALQSTPDIALPITTTETTPSLTIWIPPDTVLMDEAGAAAFSDQLLTFNANHPDLETHVEQKPVTGPGGILSYLRTGSAVAPSILPDLIVLPSSQLKTAVADGVIYPIEETLEPALFEDLYPAAQTMAQVNEQYYGYPFAITDLTHLAYQTNVITTTPPLRWNNFIENPEANFVFPAAGPAATRLVLQLYLAGGGNLVNEAGQPALDAPILTQALQPFQQGRASSFILLQSSSMASFADSWESFQAGTAVFTLTDAHHYLANRTPEIQPGFAVLPGLSTPLAPAVGGWVWAISAAEPGQRDLAAELISLLVNDVNLGEWSQQSRQLPARRSAMAQWPSDDVYTNFIKLELERAQANPINGNDPVWAVLEDAIFDVVSFTKTAQEAAAEAITALQP